MWQHMQTSLYSKLDKVMDNLYKKDYMLVYNKHLLGFAILRYLMIEVKPLPEFCVNESSCFYRASTVSKHFLLFHNDAHNHKITGILKQLKIPTVTPTCFVSRRNHHQGAIFVLS
jgi:hypothetical protein